MAQITVLQELQTANASSASTITQAITTVAGSSLQVFITCNDGQTVSTVSDTFSTFTQRDNVDDAGDGQRVYQYTADNVAAGTRTITVTYSAATLDSGIWVKEIGNTSGWDSPNGHAGQLQATPTTTADLTTSTASGTLTAAASLVSGLSMNTSGTLGPAVGTGFTAGSLGLGWTLGVTLARTEHKRVTGTTGQAVTFTAASNVSHITIVGIFKESSQGVPVLRQTFHPGRSPGIGEQSARFFQPPRAYNVSVATQSFSYTATGGLQLGGTGPEIKAHVLVATGGLVFAGAGVPLKKEVYLPTNGIVFGGSAAYSNTSNQTFIYTATGGIVFAGSGTELRKVVFLPTNGIVFGGTATKNKGFSYLPTGGLVFAGSFTELKKIVVLATSGVVFGGSASVQFITAGAGATALGMIRRFYSFIKGRR